jgi:hypothetical protein
MLKRFTAFLLAFLMLFSLVACVGEGEGTEAPAGSENVSETGAENTEKVEVPVEITAEMLAEYILRRPENVKGESITVTIEAARKLRDELKNTLGVDLSLNDDWKKATEELPATAKEILVGKTNRVEVQNALSIIKAKDFAILFENERIIITAGTQFATDISNQISDKKYTKQCRTCIIKKFSPIIRTVIIIKFCKFFSALTLRIILHREINLFLIRRTAQTDGLSMLRCTENRTNQKQKCLTQYFIISIQ